jgi:superfamily II DNA/RNA helicase
LLFYYLLLFILIINLREYFLHVDYCKQFWYFRAKTAVQGPKALILSPTRELAIQIHQEVQKYNYRGIRRFVIL